MVVFQTASVPLWLSWNGKQLLLQSVRMQDASKCRTKLYFNTAAALTLGINHLTKATSSSSHAGRLGASGSAGRPDGYPTWALIAFVATLGPGSRTVPAQGLCMPHSSKMFTCTAAFSSGSRLLCNYWHGKRALILSSLQGLLFTLVPLVKVTLVCCSVIWESCLDWALFQVKDLVIYICDQLVNGEIIKWPV